MSNQIRDFLHQPLAVGDMVVRMGGGNRSCEYGMLLHEITGFSKGKIVTRRLNVHYSWHDESGNRLKECKVEVKHTTTRISKPMTIVKVNPHPNQAKVFFDPQSYADLVGEWLHGQKNIDWDNV